MNNVKKKNEYTVLGKITVVDISTDKFPDCSMKIDTDAWLWLLDQGIGRVCCGRYYAQTNLEGKKWYVHKLITQSFQHTVDHLNHNRLDNRSSNLRDVIHADNLKNQSMQVNNTSGVTGVAETKGVKGSTWRAYIRNAGKLLYLGTFKSKEKAAAARKAAEVKFGFHPLHGAK